MWGHNLISSHNKILGNSALILYVFKPNFHYDWFIFLLDFSSFKNFVKNASFRLGTQAKRALDGA